RLPLAGAARGTHRGERGDPVIELHRDVGGGRRVQRPEEQRHRVRAQRAATVGGKGLGAGDEGLPGGGGEQLQHPVVPLLADGGEKAPVGSGGRVGRRGLTAEAEQGGGGQGAGHRGAPRR